MDKVNTHCYCVQFANENGPVLTFQMSKELISEFQFQGYQHCRYSIT